MTSRMIFEIESEILPYNGRQRRLMIRKWNTNCYTITVDAGDFPDVGFEITLVQSEIKSLCDALNKEEIDND